MGANANKIKLAEQALASHRRKLASASDKDSVRRSIKAMQARIQELKEQDSND